MPPQAFAAVISLPGWGGGFSGQGSLIQSSDQGRTKSGNWPGCSRDALMNYQFPKPAQYITMADYKSFIGSRMILISFSPRYPRLCWLHRFDPILSACY
jgi:hypothetical protein